MYNPGPTTIEELLEAGNSALRDSNATTYNGKTEVTERAGYSPNQYFRFKHPAGKHVCNVADSAAPE